MPRNVEVVASGGCALLAFVLWLVAAALSLAVPASIVYLALKFAGTL